MKKTWMVRGRVVAAAVVSVLALVSAGLVAAGTAHADPVLRDGSSPDKAALSCWEIKQNNPAAADGSYWLITPTLQAPVQLYCDQTTDGGGWVLIGKGREGWQDNYQGQGAVTDLAMVNRTPSGFNTVQLPSRTVDGLLNGGRVDSLSDGMRVLRAKSQDGSQWQNVNFKFAKRDRFVWTMPAAHQISWFQFDFGTKSGATSLPSFGNDQVWRRVTTSYAAALNWTAGFAYGSNNYSGSVSPSSFLWSPAATGYSPRPYAEVYLRPRLTAANTSFPAIGDQGTAASSQRAVASSYALPSDWGVTGNFNGRTAEGNAPVQSFAQIGNTVFVAGNFTTLQRGQSATETISQPTLAAFDSSTGQPVRTFSPTFNAQVKTIIAMPNGKLLAGGEFTVANGQPAVGTAMLDPVTGATDPSWDLIIENRLSSGVMIVRSLDVQGDYVYIGGSFTHLSTARNSNAVYAKHAARVGWSTSTPDGAWNPEFNGTVLDVDASADGSRLYASGYFSLSQAAAADKAAAVQAVAGAPLATPTWTPTWSSTSRTNYQWTISEGTNGRFYTGGSEHSLFGWSASTFDRLSGTITLQGGDFQTMAVAGNNLYAGCHCNNWAYQDAYTWSNVGTNWTQADKISWVGAWDAATGTYIPDFSPPFLNSDGGGLWAVYQDTHGNLWVGGDFTGARTSPTVNTWVGGFLRFPMNDHDAPSAPSGLASTALTGTAVTLKWNAASDDSGSLSYEVLRDDRVVGTTSTTSLAVPLGGDDRFFVRAVDTAGNRSASTRVLGDLQPPADPTLVARGSTWSYRYSAGAPDPGWNAVGYDPSSWSTGAAPIGFGTTLVATDIYQPTTSRPIVAYFRKDVSIADLSTVADLSISLVADDGAVLYVNGTEVGRVRMSAGADTYTTYANAAISTSTALANPVTFSVPVSLLREGTNTIAVSTHLNYRSSPNMSFELSAALTRGSSSAAPAPAAATTGTSVRANSVESATPAATAAPTTSPTTASTTATSTATVSVTTAAGAGG